MRLQGQVVWITGSGKRIGKAIAVGCAAEGADVVVHCRSSRAEADETAAEIEKLGRKAMVVQGDHGSPDEVGRMVEDIRERFGRLTALVNNAAQFPQKPFEEITEEDFFDVMRANAYGPFVCAQKALPMLREGNPGRIVNLTDWAVKRPYRRYAHYMASKGALHTFSMAIARELAPEVLVNEVAPGPVLEPEDLDPKVKENILKKIPIRRWGSAESIVKAVLFVLENDNLCGEQITVDGGRFLG